MPTNKIKWYCELYLYPVAPTSCPTIQPQCSSGVPTNTADKQAETPLGYTYSVEISTPNVALVPILRSGLGMLEGTLSPVSHESWSHQVLQHFRLCCQNLFQFIIWVSSANLPAFNQLNTTTTCPTIGPRLSALIHFQSPP